MQSKLDVRKCKLDVNQKFSKPKSFKFSKLETT